jgi:MFS family permease
MALAYAAIAYGNSYAMVLVGMLFAGLGMGLMIPNANVWVMQLAPPAVRGREIGRLTTFWFMGQFISPLVLLPLLDIVTLSQLFYMLCVVLVGLSIFFFGSWLWSAKVSAGRSKSADMSKTP